MSMVNPRASTKKIAPIKYSGKKSLKELKYYLRKYSLHAKEWRSNRGINETNRTHEVKWHM